MTDRSLTLKLYSVVQGGLMPDGSMWSLVIRYYPPKEVQL